MTHVYIKCRKDDPLLWVEAKADKLPPHAIEGGFDIDAETLYVGRALHQSDTIPGKIKLSSKCIFVAWGVSEHYHGEYQVLTNPKNASLSWLKYNGDIPEGAVKGGEQNDQVPLYIGRILYEQTLLIGKIHQLSKTMYVSYNGEEKKFTIPENSFSILVVHRRKTVIQRIGKAARRPVRILFGGLRIAWRFLK